MKKLSEIARGSVGTQVNPGEMRHMWLSIGLHTLAAATFTVMSATTFHFILLIPFLTGAAIGLLLYLAFILLSLIAERDSDA